MTTKVKLGPIDSHDNRLRDWEIADKAWDYYLTGNMNIADAFRFAERWMDFRDRWIKERCAK